MMNICFSIFWKIWLIPVIWVIFALCWFSFGMGKNCKIMPGIRYRVIQCAGSKWFTCQQKHWLWPFWVKCDLSNIHDTELDAWQWLEKFIRGDKVISETTNVWRKVREVSNETL